MSTISFRYGGTFELKRPFSGFLDKDEIAVVCPKCHKMYVVDSPKSSYYNQ